MKLGRTLASHRLQKKVRLPNTRTLIFGHSHVWSINRAISSGAYAPATPGFIQQVVLCGTKKFPGTLTTTSQSGARHVNSALMSTLADYPPDEGTTSWLVSAVQNNYYNILGMLNNGQPFDFVAPGFETVDRDAELIPYLAIRDSLRALMDELPVFFGKLKQMGYDGLFHVGAPPPHPSSDAIYTQLSNEPRFDTSRQAVTSKLVRLKLWAAQEGIMQEICASTGTRYLPAPPSCRDDLGFLRESLCKDAVHGNAEYATLVLKQIEDALIVDHLE